MARHHTDLLSLFTGLAVLLVGLLLLSGGSSAVPLEWAGPIAAIALGVLIVVAARPAGVDRVEGDTPVPAVQAESRPLDVSGPS